jgi:pimeloyl-ACP methyl ester carboxylesterase
MLDFRTYGTAGREIILVHGGPGAPGELAPVGRALADTFRLLEPFQRSSGGPPLTVDVHIEDLRHFILSRSSESRPALLGFSWGAMILVGCGTFDEVSRAQLNRTLEQRTNETIREAERRASVLPTDDERLQATIAAHFPLYVFAPVTVGMQIERFDARGHIETWSDMLHLQNSGIYPSSFAAIKTPVLMLHGDFDPHPGPLIRSSLEPYLAQLEYRELSRCGHYPWVERYASEELYATIRGWVGALASASGRGSVRRS